MCVGALTLSCPVPGLTLCIIDASGVTVTILISAVFTVALPVYVSAFPGAITISAIALCTDNALLTTTSTVEKAGTGSDGVLLAWVTARNFHKALTIHATVADRHFNHAMHG